jgi:hypothetical protein
VPQTKKREEEKEKNEGKATNGERYVETEMQQAITTEQTLLKARM